MSLIKPKSLFLVLFAILFALTLLGPAASASAGTVKTDALDAQSTTGPVPPPESFVADDQDYVAGAAAKVLSGVPIYLWRHGCGPTAAGMVLGYWDGHGYAWLINGSAATQTVDVNEAIASSTGARNHYKDYVLPMDDSTPAMLPDKSEPPVGDEHPANSIADFMNTSKSYYSNRYGWSWFSDMAYAFTGYITWVSGGKYKGNVTSSYWSNGSFNWNVLKAQIDAGRPMVLLVDSDGDSYTDHFIPAVGYDDSTGVRKYAAYNTWDSHLHWYIFRAMTVGHPWGIYGGVALSISKAPVTKTFYSTGAQDGWILESSETSNQGKTLDKTSDILRLGDDLANRQYRNILSFDTSSLPDTATVTNVTLRLKQHSIIGGGDPVASFLGFMVDIRKGPFFLPDLEWKDFSGVASGGYGPFIGPVHNGYYNLNLTVGKTIINKLSTNGGLTQIRIYFKLDDNDDNIAQYLNLYSGDASSQTNRPQLIVTYLP